MFSARSGDAHDPGSMAMVVALRGRTHPTLDVSPRSPSRAGLVTRLARCMSVSVLTTVISVSTLAAASVGLGMAAWTANIFATCVATVPSYHFNRRWTWGKRGVSDPWREVLPFWALAFAGLALSTFFVALTDPWMTHLHAGLAVHTGAVIGAHLSGFGILWVVQFVVLDRVLFQSA